MTALYYKKKSLKKNVNHIHKEKDSNKKTQLIVPQNFTLASIR